MLGQEAELGSKHFLPLRGSRAMKTTVGIAGETGRNWEGGLWWLAGVSFAHLIPLL